MSQRNELPQSGFNLPPGVSENDPYFTDESEEDGGREPIPCSKCGALTNWDPTYGDLCYRCCRADNE